MSFILAAISLGFLGSFHCIGMCGPIALALPVHQKSITQKIISILAYNFGRIVTYTLFGVLFGFIGESFAFFGFQQKLSIALGIIILVGLLLPQKLFNQTKLFSWIYSLLNSLKNKIANQFKKNGIKSLFSIGLLNGLLPCGLVYMGIAGSIATGSVLKGMLFMALFGLGTLPFMFSVSFTSHLISMRVRNGIRKAIPVTIAMMAILLILRGSNLGIKYISPKISADKNLTGNTAKKEIKCYHK